MYVNFASHGSDPLREKRIGTLASEDDVRRYNCDKSIIYALQMQLTSPSF